MELVFIDMMRQKSKRGGLTAQRYITEVLKGREVHYIELMCKKKLILIPFSVFGTV